MSNPVVVVAKQRSGTNLLRRTLASSQYFEDLNEVFHMNNDQPNLFWQFRQELIKENYELAFPSQENQTQIFSLFIDKISNASVDFSLIDIKYNSSHHLNHLWQDPLETPYLLELLAKNNIPIIHLVRKNIFETYVSLMTASKLNVWVSWDKSFTHYLTFKIDINHMLAFLKNLKKEINLYRQWLYSFKGIIVTELNYENLLNTQGGFSEKIEQEICDFLQISEKLNLTIPTKKIAKSLQETVENYEDEVVPALINHGFDYLVDFNDQEVIKFSSTESQVSNINQKKTQG